jgi:hypothetical protein
MTDLGDQGWRYVIDMRKATQPSCLGTFTLRFGDFLRFFANAFTCSRLGDIFF